MMISQRSGYRKEGVPLPYAILSLGISVSTFLLLGRATRDYIDAQSADSQPSEIYNTSDLRQEEALSPLSWMIGSGDSIQVDREESESEEDDEEEELEILESIGHLFLDMDEVPGGLIGSTSHVEALMGAVLEEFDAKLAAHMCYESTIESIACHGILEGKGHVSIHAWPQKGSVLLDLLVPDANFMIDEMEDMYEIFHPTMPNLFASESEFSNPVEASRWFIRNRASSVHHDSDYEESLGSPEESKFKVASLKSAFQQIDIVDFQGQSDRVDLREFREKAPEYMEANPELFAPDRVLFLDGVIQSTLQGNAAYHEALVQPSMFAHRHPKRVAIIGGGECATLREVLKHNTIEKAVMIEIDPEVVEASKYALPSWNDCSNFEGSSRYCMDDPRAEIYNEDAFKWFIDRYTGKNQTNDEELFDVIIMDALDPQNVVEFAKALYGDSSFLGALYNALSNDGILVTQVGDAPRRGDGPEHLSKDENRVIYSRSLATQGFRSIADYTEDHTGFEEPWYFYAAFKDVSTRASWMANEAELSLKIQKRAIRTIDGASPFDYFDGATMKMYQYPSQASVDIFCRREPTPVGCDRCDHGFDPERLNYAENFFNVSTTQCGKYAGRGVFATASVPRGSYLMLESTVYPITMDEASTSLFSRMGYHPTAKDNNYLVLEAFAHGNVGGSGRIQVESGLVTFVNHGCNNTFNAGRFSNITEESTVGDSNYLSKTLSFYHTAGEDYVFNPAIVRGTTLRVEHVNHWGDMDAGEEVLENKGTNEWLGPVKNLQNYCSGGDGEEAEKYQMEGGEHEGKEQLDMHDLQSTAEATAELSGMGEINMLSSS